VIDFGKQQQMFDAFGAYGSGEATSPGAFDALGIPF
jgi:hypothetical protein